MLVVEHQITSANGYGCTNAVSTIFMFSLGDITRDGAVVDLSLFVIAKKRPDYFKVIGNAQLVVLGFAFVRILFGIQAVIGQCSAQRTFDIAYASGQDTMATGAASGWLIISGKAIANTCLKRGTSGCFINSRIASPAIGPVVAALVATCITDGVARPGHSKWARDKRGPGIAEGHLASYPYLTKPAFEAQCCLASEKPALGRVSCCCQKASLQGKGG